MLRVVFKKTALSHVLVAAVDVWPLSIIKICPVTNEFRPMSRCRQSNSIEENAMSFVDFKNTWTPCRPVKLRNGCVALSILRV